MNLKKQQILKLDVWTTARAIVEDAADSKILELTESRKYLGSIRSRDYRSIIQFSEESCSGAKLPDAFRIHSQLKALFAKNSCFTQREHAVSQAKKNFFKAEELCRITNKKLDFYSQHPERMPKDIVYYLPRIRQEIANCLGESISFIRRIPDLVRLTGGATAVTKRERSLPFMKVKKSYDATAGAVPFINAFCEYRIGSRPRINLRNTNRVITVPKDWKTDRNIACEPTGNLPFQLAVDAYVKDRLILCHGIDLSSQRTNQELARIGSLDGSFATIDLSMASDTLALNTVLFLFPEDWVYLLMRLRTPCYSGVHGYGKYSKFSSMGNGFTFALETLLFTSICKSVSAEAFSVYGDDIVVSTGVAERVVRLLRFFGFIPNKDKTYLSGPFRESCGMDYFNGVNVRPFFWRYEPRSRADQCHYINGLLSICFPGARLWRYLISIIKTNKLPLVPYNEDTRSGIFIHPSDARKCKALKTKHSIDYFRAIRTSVRTRSCSDVRGYLLWCHDRTRGIEDAPTAVRSDGQRYWTMPMSRIPCYLYRLFDDLK